METLWFFIDAKKFIEIILDESSKCRMKMVINGERKRCDLCFLMQF